MKYSAFIVLCVLGLAFGSLGTAASADVTNQRTESASSSDREQSSNDPTSSVPSVTSSSNAPADMSPGTESRFAMPATSATPVNAKSRLHATSTSENPASSASQNQQENRKPANPNSRAKSGTPRAASRNSTEQTQLDLQSSVVTGNRELPKVMSIVPWKKSQPGEIAGRPSNSLLNEILTPVDREVFRRQLNYYAGIQKREQELELSNASVEK